MHNRNRAPCAAAGTDQHELSPAAVTLTAVLLCILLFRNQTDYTPGIRVAAAPVAGTERPRGTRYGKQEQKSPARRKKEAWKTSPIIEKSAPLKSQHGKLSTSHCK